MSFTAPKFTNAGKQLQAAALGGATLTFTKIKMGDGQLTSGAIAALTNLISPKVEVPITSAKRGADSMTVKGSFSNADLTTGFYWREVGLFAADPEAPTDRSRDILYCYQNAGDLAEYIPSASSSIIEKIVAIAAVVGDAANVTAVLDSQAGVTMEDVEEAIVEGIKEKADLDATGKVPADQLPSMDYIPTSEKGQAGGVACLCDDGKVPVDQLPLMEYDPAGAAGSAVASHNISPTAHADIRALIAGLSASALTATAVKHYTA